MSTEEIIKNLLIETFGIDRGEIVPEAHFSEDFNISPEEINEFLLRVGEELGFEISIEDMKGIATVSDLLELAKDRLNEI